MVETSITEKRDNSKPAIEEEERQYENTTFICKYKSALSTIPCRNFSLACDRMKPIPVENFGDHVEHMHSDRDKRFEEEYKVSGWILTTLLQELYSPYCMAVYLLFTTFLWYQNISNQ